MAEGGARVFLSYARKDGVELAMRLHKDLTARGFEVWIDTLRIGGGATWSKEIEEALDQAQAVLALLTEGSYRSDICRAEQLRALRKGKCVIPVRAQRGADIPLHLESKNYRDFSTPIGTLIADIRGGHGVELKPELIALSSRTEFARTNSTPNRWNILACRCSGSDPRISTRSPAHHLEMAVLFSIGCIGLAAVFTCKRRRRLKQASSITFVRAGVLNAR